MKINREKIVYLIGSLSIAILLNIYSNNSINISNSHKSQGTNNTKNYIPLVSDIQTKTISVPIQIMGINTNKYVVDGIPNDVNIQLTGPVADLTSTKNTQNFSVYINLKSLNEGNHMVPLKVQGLNTTLTYKFKKPKINIAIYKRAIAYYNVQPEYNNDAIEQGYKVGNVISTITNAKVIGRLNLVNQVQRIVAPVQLKRNTNKTINKIVELKALNSNGDIVNVNISPQNTHIKIPIVAGTGTKIVPIVFKYNQKLNDKYNISANINQVKISGDMGQIHKIKSIPLTPSVPK